MIMWLLAEERNGYPATSEGKFDHNLKRQSAFDVLDWRTLPAVTDPAGH